MITEHLLAKLHQLSDLELAILLSLMAREHCLISSAPEFLEELAAELSLIGSRTFGLTPSVISCHQQTTLDDFASGLLLPLYSPPITPATSSPVASRPPSPYRARTPTPKAPYFVAQPELGYVAGGPMEPCNLSRFPTQHVAHMVVVTNLDHAPRAVQMQALELMRTRRIFTRTARHEVPKRFLLVAVVGAARGGEARVTSHLNDFFYLAHWHDAEEGFANLDEYGGHEMDDAPSTASSCSVLRKGSCAGSPEDGLVVPVLTDSEISLLAQLGRQARVDVDVLRYQMNIVAFLRLHRAVDGGISPAGTKHFELLMKSLAPLHGLDYVTPSLVGLAAKKIYLHRIKMVQPARERSMQWGSDLAAIASILKDVGPEDVIDDVLGMVSVPS